MFSEREDHILKVLKGKRLTLNEITDKVFKTVENPPFDKKITISNSISRISKKCLHYKLDWSIVKIKENNKVYISIKENENI